MAGGWTPAGCEDWLDCRAGELRGAFPFAPWRPRPLGLLLQLLSLAWSMPLLLRRRGRVSCSGHFGRVPESGHIAGDGFFDQRFGHSDGFPGHLFFDRAAQQRTAVDGFRLDVTCRCCPDCLQHWLVACVALCLATDCAAWFAAGFTARLLVFCQFLFYVTHHSAIRGLYSTVIASAEGKRPASPLGFDPGRIFRKRVLHFHDQCTMKIAVPFFSPAHAYRGDGPKKIKKVLMTFRSAHFSFRYVCFQPSGKARNILQVLGCL